MWHYHFRKWGKISSSMFSDEALQLDLVSTWGWKCAPMQGASSILSYCTVYEVFVFVCAFPLKDTQVKVGVCACHSRLHVYGGFTGCFCLHGAWPTSSDQVSSGPAGSHRPTTHFGSGPSWLLIPAAPAHSQTGN